MFTVSWHVYSNFLQEPTWSRAIVVVTNTQLLNLLKQSEREREESLSKCHPAGACGTVSGDKTEDEKLY